MLQLAVIAYTSLTGNKRRLPKLRAAGWRLFVSATNLRKPSDGFLYAIDNGAWTSYRKGTPWREDLFVRAIDQLGDGAEFIVTPDIVAGGLESLELTKAWLPRLECFPLVLLPLQNGMEPDHVRELVGSRVGIFLGGDDEYKLSTMALWGTFSREVGCYYYVGRVNSQKRIHLCAQAGAHSFDGSSASMFPGKLEVFERGRRQFSFVFDG